MIKNIYSDIMEIYLLKLVLKCFYVIVFDGGFKKSPKNWNNVY